MVVAWLGHTPDALPMLVDIRSTAALALAIVDTEKVASPKVVEQSVLADRVRERGDWSLVVALPPVVVQ